MSRKQRDGYSRLQITLHWLIAVGILAAYILNDGMGRALRNRINAGETGIEGNTLHVWIGGTVFALVLVRIIVRLMLGAPAHVEGSPKWQAAAATWGHRLLYALMLIVPMAGMAAWYGHVKEAGDAHETLVNLLMIVALGHALIAIYHQFVAKDGTLMRMFRSG